MIFIGPGILFGHKIKHDFPYAYLSSDSFQHQVRAESIKDAGNFRYEARYISQGFENIVGRYPPLIYHLSVVLSYSAGIEVYDSIYLIVFFAVTLGAFVFYLVIRNFNRNIAIISLPLALMLITPPLYIKQNGSLTQWSGFGINTGFAYGHWPSLTAQFFLIVFAWCLINIELEKFYIPAGIIFSSVILSHTSEAVFGLFFTILFLTAKLLSKKLSKTIIKNSVLFFLISVLISLHYLIIFQNTWGDNRYSFAVEPFWSDPGIYLMSFKALLIFILAGIAFSLFRFRGMHTSIVFAFSMLLSGYLNYIGFGLRSFQIRFLWPLYLSVFFGLAIYSLLKFAMGEFRIIYSVLLSAALTLLLVGVVQLSFLPAYKPFSSSGLMDEYHWGALTWIAKNTGQDSKIYFFYGDIYSQDALLRNSKRVHYLAYPQDIRDAIMGKKIKRDYVTKLPGDSGGGIKARKSIFYFEDVTESKPPEYFFGPQDICNFNYIVFDKVSYDNGFVQYGALVASELLKKDYFSVAYNSQTTIILKNGKSGNDCIEEKTF